MVGFSTLHSQNAQNHYRYGNIETKLNKRAMINIAKSEIRRLVLQKKIPISWKFLSPSDIKKDQDTSHWVVDFTNAKIKSEKFKNLYISIDRQGNIRKASYSRLSQLKK